MSRLDATEGRGRSESPPSRRKTQQRGGGGLNAHLRVERRDGGLLLDTEALHFAFRRDGGVGWVYKTTVASKDEMEGFCVQQKPSISRFDAMEGWGGSKRPLSH